MPDFTYVWTAEGWLYVAAVLDLFSLSTVTQISPAAVIENSPPR
jgi:transposase InsO family protein